VNKHWFAALTLSVE